MRCHNFLIPAARPDVRAHIRARVSARPGVRAGSVNNRYWEGGGFSGSGRVPSLWQWQAEREEGSWHCVGGRHLPSPGTPVRDPHIVSRACALTAYLGLEEALVTW